MCGKTLLKRFRLLICTILITLVGVYSVYSNEQSNTSLYSYVMNTLLNKNISNTSIEKQLSELQEEYNVAMYNNIQLESYEELKKYAKNLEAEINAKIDYEIETLQLEQKQVSYKIESGILKLTSKEVSVLNRQYFKYQEEINDLLKDKTSLYTLFSSNMYSKMDVTELEKSLEERIGVGVINYDRIGSNLGDINKLHLPFDYKKVVTSNAGYRTDPIDGTIKYHNATDYAMPVGTKLYSVFNGKVILSENSNNGYGQNIKIDCGNGLILHYAHLSKRNVKVGDIVTQNQLIGLSGNTGRSTGPHLHLSLFYNGEVLDIERLF